MNCIGIDPAYAKPIAWAYKLHDGTWATGQYEPVDVHKMRKSTFKRARARGVTHAVIEGGYVGRNAATSLKLAEMRGQLIATARIAKLEVIEVAPRTWQIACLTISGVTPKTHKDIVKAAKFAAKAHSGLDLSEDKAVAACLAHWGNSQLH